MVCQSGPRRSSINSRCSLFHGFRDHAWFGPLLRKSKRVICSLAILNAVVVTCEGALSRLALDPALHCGSSTGHLYRARYL